ncbi:ATP-binding protein [Fusobacterium sp.]|uniref:ATP-binding protein n=1 Tax=Fusobacterium sp. TaxID=68766 RepID=UPI00260AD169|nr:ATP-binding protein [Fusobacterium sp.]
MKIDKSSIVFKIIFYTNIAIISSSIVVASIITFITFQDMEAKLLNTAKEKVFILEKAHMNYIFNMRGDITQILLKNGDFCRNLEKVNYESFSRILKEELIRNDFRKYYQIEIALFDKKGRILGYSGDNIFEDELLFTSEDFDRIIKTKKYYTVKSGNELYSRIILHNDMFKEEKDNGYIVLSVPLNNNILRYMREYIELSSSDKIFILSSTDYLYGDFKKKPKEKVFLLKNQGDNVYKYSYRNIEINEKPYYIVTSTLNDIDQKNVLGYLGVGISRENFLKTKIIIAIFIGIMVLSFVTIATTFFSKILKSMLLPLNKISNAAEEISNGNYNTIIDFDGIGEVKLLEVSLKGMLKKLEDNQRTLKIRNKKLKENLKKMKSVEELILSLETESDIKNIVRKIMKTFVSEADLGFMRGMFFRYSREKNVFIGEMCLLNNHITEIRNDILKERKNGFEFQTTQLEDVIKLIKIPFSEENFISESFKKKQSNYVNDKAYKYNLGNDLFNTIGLKNFVAIPIYNIDYYSGVMLFDYYTKDKEITEEDIELIKILVLNVTTKLKNKVEEKERIEEERNRTINNITERFLTTREEALNKLVSLMQEKDNIDLEELANEIQEFKSKVKNIKYSNKILKQYSNPSDRKKLEPVNIEHFMVEVIGVFRGILKEDGNEDKVTIASFISYTEDVLGNRERLKRAFLELLKNSYDAVLANEKSDKKITIIVTRDKIANKIKIEIKDNGIGMDEEQLKYISQPFMTYKGDTPGLGIPLVERVIKDCKGVIKFYSNPQKGTEIKITLNIFKEEK